MKNKGWNGWRGVKTINGKLAGENQSPSKMGNIITIVDGIRYHSKAEGRYAANLNNLVKAGAIKFYLRQIGFDLPGHSRHFVDFLIFYPDGTWKFVEAKGRDLPLGKLKRRQVEELYGIKVEVIK
jgi:hypothetical protein